MTRGGARATDLCRTALACGMACGVGRPAVHTRAVGHERLKPIIFYPHIKVEYTEEIDGTTQRAGSSLLSLYGHVAPFGGREELGCA